MEILSAEILGTGTEILSSEQAEILSSDAEICYYAAEILSSGAEVSSSVAVILGPGTELSSSGAGS